MKKGQITEGRVRRAEFPNKGIVVTEEGAEAVVKNCIPGQKISFLVKKMRRGKCEGRLLEVIEKSPLEQEENVCPHFGICGGCTYQSLSYEKQLELKEGQLRRLLLPAAETEGRDFDDIFMGIKPSPQPCGYRNKMEFSFGDSEKGGPLALGMHKRGSFYDIVNVDQCRIVDADFRRALVFVRNFFEEKGISYYHKMRHEGYLRHLLVRKATKTGEILIDLVTSSRIDGFDETHILEEMKEGILKLPFDGSIAGILHTKNDSLADVVLNDGTDILYGQDYFYEELLGLKFKITPFSFFQTNSLGAEVLYDTVREFVLAGDSGKKPGTVFDLYSGTGTIAQMLSPAADKVYGVEIIEEAVKAAKENAALNGLTNCEFLAGDVLTVIDGMKEKPDLVVLDPPRDGIHPKALSKIGGRIGAERIVYISCKPTSLVRDLEALKGYGYVVEKICGVDMFPGTYHVETVCLLSKLHSDQHIEVELQMDELDLTAAESKATYEEIKDYVLKHTGLKVSSLYIAQVKEKCGIIERVNYNLSKSENARQPKCPPEKEAAIREALGYFRMI
ncbi:23S rRNA (uracil(1939)-C(5))-methyltransferase RlmD [Lachnospiraceae bacterium]|nr:23S rRNA (uracil(1939)-C(5))-methyltransferase RlmD [Lachnospiraceae bacterium]